MRRGSPGGGGVRRPTRRSRGRHATSGSTTLLPPGRGASTRGKAGPRQSRLTGPARQSATRRAPRCCRLGMRRRG
jgi:hypothetical protein